MNVAAMQFKGFPGDIEFSKKVKYPLQMTELMLFLVFYN